MGDALVGRTGHPDEGIECVGVPADQHARASALHRAKDDTCRLVGAHVGQLVELLRECGVVAARGLVGVAGDVGVDATGVHAADAHLVPGDEHLLAQRLGEPAHAELRGVVGALGGHADQAEDAGQVDDVAVAGSDEVRQERLGAVHDAPEVDAHDPVEIVPGHVLDGGHQGDACVVDHEVDLPELGDDRVGVGEEGCPVGHVELVADGLRADLLAGRDGVGQRNRVDVGQGEPGAPLGQRDGERPADAGAGAGDDGDLVGEMRHGFLSDFRYRQYPKQTVPDRRSVRQHCDCNLRPGDAAA